MNVSKKSVMGLAGLVLVVGALATACSSSSTPAAPPPCNESPFECPAGQTCWVTSASNTYACLNSGPGQAGASCLSTVDVPTCGDGLVCLQMTQGAAGTCVEFCEPTDPSHACSGGAACEPVAFNGSTTVSFYVCSGAMTVPADSGAPG
jgi:hypothetical protein